MKMQAVTSDRITDLDLPVQSDDHDFKRSGALKKLELFIVLSRRSLIKLAIIDRVQIEPIFVVTENGLYCLILFFAKLLVIRKLGIDGVLVIIEKSNIIVWTVSLGCLAYFLLSLFSPVQGNFRYTLHGADISPLKAGKSLKKVFD